MGQRSEASKCKNLSCIYPVRPTYAVDSDKGCPTIDACGWRLCLMEISGAAGEGESCDGYSLIPRARCTCNRVDQHRLPSFWGWWYRTHNSLLPDIKKANRSTEHPFLWTLCNLPEKSVMLSGLPPKAAILSLEVRQMMDAGTGTDRPSDILCS